MSTSILFAYLVGVILHIAWKWCGWKAQHTGAQRKPWLCYWRDYAAINIQGAIAALMLAFTWEQGWMQLGINAVADKIAATFGHEGGFAPLQTTFLSSATAGFLQDMLAKDVLLRVREKRSE